MDGEGEYEISEKTGNVQSSRNAETKRPPDQLGGLSLAFCGFGHSSSRLGSPFGGGFFGCFLALARGADGFFIKAEGLEELLPPRQRNWFGFTVRAATA